MQRRLALIWLPVVAGLLLGASLASGQLSRQPTRLTPAERAQCTARHGRILIAGLLGNEMCALPYADGGRRCTDSAQCAGDCRYEGSLKAGSRAAGRCQAFAYPFGCRTTIERGRVTPGLCVD